ncbi:MAG: response regulator [Pseudonocardiaceae bacterium]
MIRVVVVDDQLLIRAGITMVVNAQEDITVVAEAVDGKDALIKVRSQRPDVVLMDVRMTDNDGIAATRAILDEGLTTENGNPIRVIILTTFHHDEYVHAALGAGASGFLLKDAPPSEITTAIRSVAAGDAWLNPTVTRRLLGEFVSQPERHTTTPAQMTQLTQREREVLILLAQGQTNAEVAKNLSITETTVRTYVSHVLKKLRVREKAQAVAAAYQTGLIIQPRPSK